MRLYIFVQCIFLWTPERVSLGVALATGNGDPNKANKHYRVCQLCRKLLTLFLPLLESLCVCLYNMIHGQLAPTFQAAVILDPSYQPISKLPQCCLNKRRFWGKFQSVFRPFHSTNTDQSDKLSHVYM